MNIHGNKGGGTPGIEHRDTIQVSGSAYSVDIISEGEIVGLVSGKQSIFFDRVPLENLDGSSEFSVTHDFFNEASHFKVGEDGGTQAVLPSPFDNTRIPIQIPSNSSLTKGKTIISTFNTNSYPNVTEVSVNIGFTAMFRNWDKTSIDTPSTFYSDPNINIRINSLRVGRNPGDVTKTPVRLKIYIQHNFGDFILFKDLIINHKSSSGFIFSKKIALPIDENEEVQHYSVKVERDTENSPNLKIVDEAYVDSIALKVDAKFRHPHSSLCALKFDAETFPSLPERRYLLDLLKVKIPSNYTPAEYDSLNNRIVDPSYSGVWDGTFIEAWTNNPAWIFYDLITNQRYGLGEYIGSDKMDKWTLYSIGRYCDAVDDNGAYVGVNDGKDGTEQRFTANLMLTSVEDAYTIIKYFSSIFRGVTYWMSGLIFPIQDRPKEITQLFTNANVVDGAFNYSSTEKQKRRTVISVRWNDPDDFYLPKVERVEDTEGILKHGINEGEIAAFACTSRGQAHRVGKWTLLTEKLESEIVQFRTGLEGVYSRPGDIVDIYDDFKLQQKFGGRVRESVDNSTILLDRAVDLPLSPGAYDLTLSSPKFNRDPSVTGPNGVNDSDDIDEIRSSQIEKRDVSSSRLISGQWTEITVSSPFSNAFTDVIWSLSVTNAETLEITGASQYRILGIGEVDGKQLELTAIEYKSGKFDEVESNFSTKINIDSDYSNSVLGPPTNLQLSLQEYLEGDEYAAYVQAYWTQSTGANVVNHVASGRIEGGDWSEIQVDVETDTGARFYIFESGLYDVQVKAHQAGGALSTAISGSIIGTGTGPFGTGTGALVPLSGIILDNNVFGTLDTFSDPEPIFNFPTLPTGSGGFDSRFSTTIGVTYSLRDEFGARILRNHIIDIGESIKIPYNGISSQGDTITGWPLRDFSIEASTFDIFGNRSEIKSLSVQNPAPSPGSLITFPSRNLNAFNYAINPVEAVTDLSGVNFYLSEVDLKPDNPIATIPTLNGTLIHNLNISDPFVWFEIADNYSASGLALEGSFQYDSSINLNFPAGFGVTGAIFTETGVFGNEINNLRFYWPPFTGDSISSYEIDLESANNTSRRYPVAHDPLLSDDVDRVVTNVPAIDFSGRVRGIDTFGASTSWSSYSNVVSVPEPVIKYLEVNGSGRFFGHTSTEIFKSGITTTQFGSVDLDFGVSNLIHLRINNTGVVTINPTNIVSGAMYNLKIERVAGTGTIEWDTEFSWPNSVSPTGNLAATEYDIFSFAAYDGTSLDGSFLPNFGV